MILRKMMCLGLGLLLPSLAWSQGNCAMVVEVVAGAAISGGMIYNGGAMGYGPFTNNHPDVNMDAFHLQYGGSFADGSVDSRNQNYPTREFASILVPSSATMTSGIGLPGETSIANTDSWAGSSGSVTCRKNDGAGPTSWEWINDGTIFSSLHSSGLAAGGGTASVMAHTTLNTVQVINYVCIFSDPTILPPGYAIYPVSGTSAPAACYTNATPGGNVTIYITAPVASLTATWGSPGNYVKTNDAVSASVRSSGVGSAPIGFINTQGQMVMMTYYATNTSVQTVTTVLDPTENGGPPCNPYAGGPPGGGPGPGPGSGSGSGSGSTPP